MKRLTVKMGFVENQELTPMCRARITLAIGTILLVTGCASVGRRPSATDIQAIHRGEKALVLIGIDAAWNDKPEDPIQLFTTQRSFPPELPLASLAGGDGLAWIRPWALPPEGRASQRWLTLVLAPGSYYLWGMPETLLQRDVYFSPREVGGFWLEVLPDQPVQYAGTLQYDMHGSQFLMERFFKRLSISVRDDRTAAENIAEAHFSQDGKMTTSLMRRYEEPAPVQTDLFPIVVSGHETGALRSPDWRRRATGIALAPARGAVEFTSGSEAVIFGGALALVYSAFAAPVGMVKGNADAKRWQPCVTNLQTELTQQSPARQLRQQLGAALATDAVLYAGDSSTLDDPGAVAAKHNCRIVLMADIRAVRLQECTRGKFCVEVVARVCVWDPQANRSVFDQTAIYTNPQAQHTAGENSPAGAGWLDRYLSPPPYELVLPTVSPERAMAEYCGPDGVKIFADELATAVGQFAEFFTSRLCPPAVADAQTPNPDAPPTASD